MWPTNAPSRVSPTSSVEDKHSLHRLKFRWIIAVIVNIVGMMTDLASYVPSPEPSSMQVNHFAL